MPDVAGALAQIEKDNRNDLALLRESTAPAVVAALLTLRRESLDAASIKRDPRYSDLYAGQAYVAAVQAARAKANTAIDKAEQYARQAGDNIRADLKAKTTPKLDTQGEILAELKKAAARRQIDLMVGANATTEQVISSLAARGDAVALQCVREDLQAGLKNSGFSAETLLAQLDQAEAPLLSAMHQAARQIEAELATGFSQLTTTFALARQEASGSQSTAGNVNMASRILDWAKGASLPVAFTTQDGGLTTGASASATGTTGYVQPPTPNYGKPNADGQ